MPALVKALKDQGAEDIVVFVGGVIPAQDYDFLYKAGAAGIFGPAPHLPPAPSRCWRPSRPRVSTREPSRTSLTGWLIR